MSVRRATILAAVGLLAAATTVGAGLASLRRGPVSETRVVSEGNAGRFEWVDVFVRGDAPVGAWQVELHAAGESAMFVGVEGELGGEPPVYDAAALSAGERLVIGGIGSPTAKAPVEPGTEKRRVARVHLQVSGRRVEILGELTALGDGDGKRIGGKIELVRGEAVQP